MPRNFKSTAHFVKPDPRFGSLLASKIINQVMVDGKKSVAQAVFYDAVARAHKKLPDVEDPSEIPGGWPSSPHSPGRSTAGENRFLPTAA
jgi:hypothetical protein